MDFRNIFTVGNYKTFLDERAGKVSIERIEEKERRRRENNYKPEGFGEHPSDKRDNNPEPSFSRGSDSWLKSTKVEKTPPRDIIRDRVNSAHANDARSQDKEIPKGGVGEEEKLEGGMTRSHTYDELTAKRNLAGDTRQKNSKRALKRAKSFNASYNNRDFKLEEFWKTSIQAKGKHNSDIASFSSRKFEEKGYTSFPPYQPMDAQVYKRNTRELEEWMVHLRG